MQVLRELTTQSTGRAAASTRERGPPSGATCKLRGGSRALCTCPSCQLPPAGQGGWAGQRRQGCARRLGTQGPWAERRALQASRQSFWPEDAPLVPARTGIRGPPSTEGGERAPDVSAGPVLCTGHPEPRSPPEHHQPWRRGAPPQVSSRCRSVVSNDCLLVSQMERAAFFFRLSHFSPLCLGHKHSKILHDRYLCSPAKWSSLFFPWPCLLHAPSPPVEDVSLVCSWVQVPWPDPMVRPPGSAQGAGQSSLAWAPEPVPGGRALRE